MKLELTKRARAGDRDAVVLPVRVYFVAGSVVDALFQATLENCCVTVTYVFGHIWRVRLK